MSEKGKKRENKSIYGKFLSFVVNCRSDSNKAENELRLLVVVVRLPKDLF